MGQVTGLIVYYIEFLDPKAPPGNANSRAQDLTKKSKILGPATSSACTITMDHDAIICAMIDRLVRGPDQDVHIPSVGSQKYPSRGVDVIYLYLTIGGVVWGPTRPLVRFLGALG